MGMSRKTEHPYIIFIPCLAHLGGSIRGKEERV